MKNTAEPAPATADQNYIRSLMGNSNHLLPKGQHVWVTVTKTNSRSINY